MRIAILSDGFPPNAAGGAEQIACNFARGLAHLGHDISVITTTQKKELVGEAHENGMRIIRIYSNYHPRWRAYLSLYNPSTIPAIASFFKKEQFDVVHAHNIHYHISYHALKLAARSCGRVFLTAHDTMMVASGKLYPESRDCRNTRYPTGFFRQLRKEKFRFNPFRSLVIRCYLSYVQKTLCVSGAVERVLNANGINNTVVFYSGVSVARNDVKENEASAFRQKYGLADSKVILFGGRISFGKGGLYALEYLQKVLMESPDTVLLVAGRENEITALIRGKASQAGVDSHIIFAGWLSADEMQTAYSVSDVVIVPSLYMDPIPTVNLEAMAFSKPVVATCFGGSNEAVMDGETGYIANPYDIEAFSKRIINLLADGTKRAAYGEAGCIRVCKNFDIVKRAEALAELYLSKN